MEFTDALRLMGIEKRCVQRNSLSLCDRKCERCDLVQKDTDLIEAFQMAEFALEKLIKEDKMPTSNADRIRSMSDEELAEFLRPVKCVDCHLLDCGVEEMNFKKTCEERILDWLREEVSE